MENKINFSKNDVLYDDEFGDSGVKVRITTYIDKDILESLKEKAKVENTKYQSLLNQVLRKSLFSSESLEDDIKSIKSKLENIEKKVS